MIDDWDVIFSYSRKQAIEDGVLIQVDEEVSREAGFKIPISMTSTVYDRYVNTQVPGKDEAGRLWDILFMLLIHAANHESDTILFDVAFQRDEEEWDIVPLKAVVGPGDDLSPVLTIMLPEED